MPVQCEHVLTIGRGIWLALQHLHSCRQRRSFVAIPVPKDLNLQSRLKMFIRDGWLFMLRRNINSLTKNRGLSASPCSTALSNRR
jgi:hypothetical protein